MKKILLALAAVALISLPIVMNSCSEDNPVSCTKLINDITSAAFDYSANQTSATCNDYKDALKEYLDSDCDLAGTSYQTIYNNLSCY